MITKYKKAHNNLKPEEIVEYWKNKDRKIIPKWENALEECWACGRTSNAKLEKCHIIPECLGGEMLSSNMVLLCSLCHYQNPETI